MRQGLGVVVTKMGMGKDRCGCRRMDKLKLTSVTCFIFSFFFINVGAPLTGRKSHFFSPKSLLAVVSRLCGPGMLTSLRSDCKPRWTTPPSFRQSAWWQKTRTLTYNRPSSASKSSSQQMSALKITKDPILKEVWFDHLAQSYSTWTYRHLGPQSWCLSGKESACQCRRHRRRGFDPQVGKIPWRRKWQPTPVFLPGKSHGQKSQGGVQSMGSQELDTTQGLNHHQDFAVRRSCTQQNI